MQQTPVHDQHNQDLLSLIPKNSKNLIEIGCSSGALAREYKKISPDCNYYGVEIDPAYAEMALSHCNDTTTLDIDVADEVFYEAHRSRDCWIFGDTLEHLRDPWKVLEKISKVIPENGSVVACIPNVQHWSMQVRLSIGDFRYRDNGLLDRTHLRWFTRQTIFELFSGAGFRITAGKPRIFNEPAREQYLPLIKQMASLAGADPKRATEDCLPLQYVVRAEPVPK